MSGDPEFYVGHADSVSPVLGRAAIRRWAAVMGVVISVALVFAVAQEDLPPKYFEWDRVRSFEGRIRLEPTPHLMVDLPSSDHSVRLALVGPRKSGARSFVEEFDGERVRLDAHLLYRDGRTMAEVVPESVHRLGRGASDPVDSGLSLGPVSLEGEIVDTKCFLGAMNPGRSKVHRACAVRCISGGIPPALWVRGQDGGAVVLLVDSEGRSVNDRVLGMVAEGVRIRGELWRYDDLLVLRSDPEDYQRLSR